MAQTRVTLYDEIKLKSVDHRDEDTWGYHLLNVMEQGFGPDYTIADGGSGLRAGQKAAMPEIPALSSRCRP